MKTIKINASKPKYLKMNLQRSIAISILVFLLALVSYGQQDPQFTDYMFNPLTVNSAYAGSRGHLTFTGLHRSQWVGLDGAPTTQSFSIDSPVGKKVGLGFSIINDKIGPSDEFFLDANFSYTINLSYERRLSFGVKGGARLLNVDFNRDYYQEDEDIFQQNIRNKFLPTIGAGVYLHSDTSYIGVSAPNFLTDVFFDDIKNTISAERLHFFLTAGKVFDLSYRIKFKPAVLVKFVVGSPIIFDLSANALYNDIIRVGLSYRWDDSVSALLGLQITEKLMIGYAYDYTTTELEEFNSGTHEIMLRFELRTKQRQLKSPRFF